MRREIYLDNNATTKALPCVVEDMLACLNHGFGNPSSPHTRGRKARKSLEAARQAIADLMSVLKEDVFFTSGATEANNTIIRSAANQGRTIICTEAEHPSVYEVASQSAKVIKIPLQHDGIVDLARMSEALAANPGAIVAMHWANGETGVLQPVDEICKLARTSGAQTLFDAAQAVGRIPASQIVQDYDFLTFSAHKLHGPQGVGVLCAKSGGNVTPLILGGGQEAGIRSGTENLPGVVGIGSACKERLSNLDRHLSKLSLLRDAFEGTLARQLDDTIINGSSSPRVPNTTNVTVRGVEGQALAARLDAAGVICSQVSACSSARPTPSRTLIAMGLSEDEAFSSLRFSFSILNTLDEAKEAAEIVATEARFLREFFGCVQ